MNKAQIAALQAREALNRKAAGQELADLQAEVDRLRAVNAALLGMLDSIWQLADAGAVCSPGTCEECDLLRELRGMAEKAIEEGEAE